MSAVHSTNGGEGVLQGGGSSIQILELDMTFTQIL